MGPECTEDLRQSNFKSFAYPQVGSTPVLEVSRFGARGSALTLTFSAELSDASPDFPQSPQPPGLRTITDGAVDLSMVP